MDYRIVFLIVCGVLTGCCFVVGCTASVIKAVRDRRRILKKQSEQNGIEERDTQSENHQILKRSDKTIDFQRTDSGISDRQRKPGISGTQVSEKSEIDYGSMETSHHSSSGNVGNSVQLSVMEKHYGAHSQSTNLVLNDEKLSDLEKDKKEIWQDDNGSSGTFVVDTEAPVARTRSYQVAMTKNVSTESSSSLGHADPDWSSRENILKIDC